MLAIIIPFYKIFFFDATLESLANQTDKRFKVYIGDDASPEDPLYLLEKHKDQFEFVYHKFDHNLGGISLTKQWERCIALSGSEEWIMILGDDDVLTDNVIEEFYKGISEVRASKSKVIRFSSCKIDEFGEVVGEIYKHPKIETSKYFFLERKSRSSLSEYVFNKKDVNKIGFKNFPLGWYSDYLAVLEYSSFGNVFSINSAFVKIRISTFSISGSKSFVKQKQKARIAFYSYLLTNKRKYFSEKEIKELLWMLNKTFLNNKRNILLLLEISKFYLKNKFIRDYYSLWLMIINKAYINNESRFQSTKK